MLPLLADDGLARFGTLLAACRRWPYSAFGGPAAKPRRWSASSALGAAALSGAVHVASLFLGLEITSLALIGLFVLPLTAASLEAGYKYLLPGAAGSAALLMGAALAYAATGRLDLTAWHVAGPQWRWRRRCCSSGSASSCRSSRSTSGRPMPTTARRPATAALAGSAAKAAVVVAMLRIDVACQPSRSGTRGWRCSPSPRSSSAIWRRCGNRRSPASSGIRRWRIRAILRR